MRTKAEFINPGVQEVALTFTMSLAAWEKLREQFEQEHYWPASDVVDAIRELSSKMRGTVNYTAPVKADR